MCRLSDGAGKDDSKNKIVGGETIAGQIASFIENLNLSYKEVYEELPYLLVVLMVADKPRTVYGDNDKVEVKKMSGKELMMKKIGR